MCKQKGSVTIEFAMVGVPLIFALISMVEMSRGMWMYCTQAYALNEAARYVSVHGVDCRLPRWVSGSIRRAGMSL
jgi:Flp pilus assembly protein TadG